MNTAVEIQDPFQNRRFVDALWSKVYIYEGGRFVGVHDVKPLSKSVPVTDQLEVLQKRYPGATLVKPFSMTPKARVVKKIVLKLEPAGVEYDWGMIPADKSKGVSSV